MFISNDEKSKIWDNISELLKKNNALNAMSADLIFLTGKVKALEGKLVKLESVQKVTKQKTAAQIQRQKEKQREYNRRYAAKKKFEQLEKLMAEKAERSGYATSVSAASQ